MKTNKKNTKRRIQKILRPKHSAKTPAQSSIKTPTQHLHQLQRKIYHALQSQADLLLGKMPLSIRRYEKECQKDFSTRLKTLKTIEKEELIQRVQSSDVTFIADFHTFDQTQRTALRVVREAYDSDTQWLIGLELVPSHHQEVLDRFQRGELSEAEFHLKISYAQEWGFPWENYRPLFDWARENQVRIIALNRPKALRMPLEEKELHDRDQWAAGIITDLFADHFAQLTLAKGVATPLRMIVLYGEHHVGSAHLPTQLEKISRSALGRPLSWLTLHQNQADLYWKLIEQNPNLLHKTIVLKKGIYCLFSATPWAKLQSLVNWAEHDLTDSYSDPLEDQVDYLSLIKTYGTTLSEFLGVSAPSFGAITVCTIEEANGLEDGGIEAAYSREEIELIHFLVSTNRSLYLARLGIAYLGSPSHHRAAEMAAMHVLKLSKDTPVFERSEEGFYRIVLAEVFVYFCSLILNPHRKCDLPSDHRKRLKTLSQGEKESFPLEKKARMLVLDLLSSRRAGALKKVLSSNRQSPVAMIAARFQGKILGKRLHQALLAEKVTLAQIRGIFFNAPTLSYRAAFLGVYKISLQFSEQKSKTEAL